MDTPAVLAIFKAAGWRGKVFKNREDALAGIEKENIRPVWCGRRSPRRYVNPGVCDWHFENEDPICKQCRHNPAAGIRSGSSQRS